jgi:hypothetical protein
MMHLKKIFILLSVVFFVGTATGSPSKPKAPTSKDLSEIAAVSVKTYQNYQTVDQFLQWAEKHLDRQNSQFLLQKAQAFRSEKLPSLSLVENEFSLTIKDRRLKVKLLDPDVGRYQVEHRFVTLPPKDLETTWEILEKTLSSKTPASLFNLFIPSAKADPMLVALAVIGIVGVNAFVQIAWADHQTEKALESCEATRQEGLKLENSQDPKKLASFKALLENAFEFEDKVSPCESNKDAKDTCKVKNKYYACLAELRKMAKKWNLTLPSNSDEAPPPAPAFR